MSRFCFLIDGIRVFLYSLPGADTDLDEIREGMKEGELAVIIRPERDVDFLVDCFDKDGNSPREGYIAFAVLSYFFSRVRGLPPQSFDVLYHGNMYILAFGERAVNFSVNVGKCKLLCTKTAIFTDGIEISADLILSKNECIVTVCEDSDLFDEGRLMSLGEALGRGPETPTLAVSLGDSLRIKRVGDIPYYDAITVAVYTLLRRAKRLDLGKTMVYLDGCEYTVARSAEVLTFYPDIKYLY